MALRIILCNQFISMSFNQIADFLVLSYFNYGKMFWLTQFNVRILQLFRKWSLKANLFNNQEKFIFLDISWLLDTSLGV